MARHGGQRHAWRQCWRCGAGMPLQAVFAAAAEALQGMPRMEVTHQVTHSLALRITSFRVDLHLLTILDV